MGTQLGLILDNPQPEGSLTLEPTYHNTRNVVQLTEAPTEMINTLKVRVGRRNTSLMTIPAHHQPTQPAHPH